MKLTCALAEYAESEEYPEDYLCACCGGYLTNYDFTNCYPYHRECFYDSYDLEEYED